MALSLFRFTLSSSALLAASTAVAEVPKVVTDIAPVHALVSQVMGDLGQPELLVDPGNSPHHYSLRPSQALALERADMVVWIGEPLTPWLHEPLETLAEGATHLELLEADGTIQHNFRETVVFGGGAHDDHDDHDKHDDHGHEEHVHDDHRHDDHADHDKHDDHDDHGHKDHDDHDDHGHEKHDDHEGHDHDSHKEHDHDHDGVDPHAWLDPENGRIWLDVIAGQLSALDPENAATYRANADAGKAELAEVIAQVHAQLEPVEGKPFVVFHDAYQYFETRFHLQALGAIRVGDATDPSPARIAEIQEAVRDANVACAFSEPQFSPRLIQTVFDGLDVNVAALDPLGADQPEGAARYAGIIKSVADEIETCLN
jgi:zinc transport system substrate-binding protein